MKRRFDPSNPELMDRPQPVNEALRGALRNLALLNRCFGGVPPVRRFLEPHTSPARPIRVLDLACGYADIPRALIRWSRQTRRPLTIHAVDFHPATLALARAASRGFPELTFEQADALTYEAREPFDVVLNTLSLHHFTEGQAVSLLRSVLRNSHRGAFVSDLRRSRAGLLALRALTTLLLRNPITRADALASMQAAFSGAELRSLALLAGWEHFEWHRLPHFRQGISIGI